MERKEKRKGGSKDWVSLYILLLIYERKVVGGLKNQLGFSLFNIYVCLFHKKYSSLGSHSQFVLSFRFTGTVPLYQKI